MRRLLLPSRTDHDPLAGRTWEGFTHNEYVTVDDEVYLFYRYDSNTHHVELEEPLTRILWWYPADYFKENAMPDPKESAMFYQAHKEDTITKRRQAARYTYMEGVANRDGVRACENLTPMADKWWPGTTPTKYENGEM